MNYSFKVGKSLKIPGMYFLAERPKSYHMKVSFYVTKEKNSGFNTVK